MKHWKDSIHQACKLPSSSSSKCVAKKQTPGDPELLQAYRGVERRDPIAHLNRCKHALAPGGELVLETLIIRDANEAVLRPDPRYAQMRNVWYLPSTAALTVWMQKVGFKNIRVVDVAPTSLQEQRATEWMDSQSLADFLDPNNPTKTIEPC